MKSWVIYISLLLAPTVWAGAPCTETPQDGRCWVIMNASDRTFYVSGFMDALVNSIAVGGDSNAEKATLNRYLPSALRVGEITASLDLFYGEPENRLIFVPLALEILARKTAKGLSWTDEEIVAMIANYRAICSQVKTDQPLKSDLAPTRYK